MKGGNNMSFEIWDASEEFIAQDIPWVRLSKNGSIVLSKFLKNALGNRIQIAFDKKNRTIRLKSVGEDEPAVNCLKTKIIAKAFFSKYNINIEQATKYLAVWDDKEQGWLFKLN
jgi:hypothetical protein